MLNYVLIVGQIKQNCGWYSEIGGPALSFVQSLFVPSLDFRTFQEIFVGETLCGSGGIERHRCELLQATSQAAVPWSGV